MAGKEGVNISDYENLEDDEKINFDTTDVYKYKTKYGTLYFYKRRSEEEIEQALEEIGKKNRENERKNQKKKREFEIRLNQIRNEDNITISEEEYNLLPQDMKNNYKWERIMNGNQLDHYYEYRKGDSLQNIERKKLERLNEIRNTKNIIISQKEYDTLPRDLKDNYEWNRLTQGHQRDQYYEYRKGLSLLEIETKKNDRLLQIRNDPNIVLENSEYEKLPLGIKNGINWVSYNTGPQWDLTKYWRKETQKDTKKRQKEEAYSELNKFLYKSLSRVRTNQKTVPVEIEADYGNMETIFLTQEEAQKYFRLKEFYENI